MEDKNSFPVCTEELVLPLLQAIPGYIIIIAIEPENTNQRGKEIVYGVPFVSKLLIHSNWVWLCGVCTWSTRSIKTRHVLSIMAEFREPVSGEKDRVDLEKQLKMIKQQYDEGIFV